MASVLSLVRHRRQALLRVSPSIPTLSIDREEKRPRQKPSSRLYSSTPKREILPVVALGVVAVVGHYSWRAWRRMDNEWKEYEWELQEYQKLQAKQQTNEGAARTLALDLGTIQTRLATTTAHNTTTVNEDNMSQVQIEITASGERSFFNGVIDAENEEDVIHGQQAIEKFFYDIPEQTENCPVELPWNLLETHDHFERAKELILHSISPALNNVLDRLDNDHRIQQASSDEVTGEQAVDPAAVRSVVTVPDRFAAYYTVFSDINPVFVPEPVASIWGAQHCNILPTDLSSHDNVCIVVDVGGFATQVSAVRHDVVLYHATLPWGGERWIELLVQLLRNEVKRDDLPLTDARSLSALQVQARTALAELSTQSRVNIHVPYLLPTPGDHHLDTSMSRSVLEQAIQQDVAGLKERTNDEDKAWFSPHLANPSDAAALWTSLLTQLLEHCQLNPIADVDHVLLVGGAARAPFVAKSLKDALFAITGDDKLLVVPDNAALPELTVLGAATMLPNYTYDIERGMVRLPGM